jgi:hypothetical protein
MWRGRCPLSVKSGLVAFVQFTFFNQKVHVTADRASHANGDLFDLSERIRCDCDTAVELNAFDGAMKVECFRHARAMANGDANDLNMIVSPSSIADSEYEQRRKDVKFVIYFVFLAQSCRAYMMKSDARRSPT